jgi:hypothetical protein
MPPSSGPNQLGFQSSSGAPHSVGNSDLRRLRGILEIPAPGLFLPSPDLSIGIFLRVIGHIWQQGQVIEGFSLLLECGILQLESLAFRSACIDLHFLFSLWRHYFVLAGAFCSSSYLLLVRPSEVYARSAIYCIDLTLLIIKRSDLCLCFYILNIL